MDYSEMIPRAIVAGTTNVGRAMRIGQRTFSSNNLSMNVCRTIAPQSSLT